MLPKATTECAIHRNLPRAQKPVREPLAVLSRQRTQTSNIQATPTLVTALLTNVPQRGHGYLVHRDTRLGIGWECWRKTWVSQATHTLMLDVDAEQADSPLGRWHEHADSSGAFLKCFDG
jgi:hypothetical protein